MGLFGAVVDGVSVKAEPFVPPCLPQFWGAAKLPPDFSSGVVASSVLGVDK